MFSQSLKTNIAVHLAVLLLLAMVLIDFVMIIVAQKALLQSERSKGYIFLTGVENSFNALFASKNTAMNSAFKRAVDNMRKDTAFSGALIMDDSAKAIYSDADSYPYFDELKSVTLQAMQSGKKNERFLETTWGVFWERSRRLIISMPLFREGRIIAGAGVVVSLENVYKNLRQTQYLLLVYICINTIVLTLIGFYRLTKATVKPLQRLLERADEYRGDDEVFFRYERTDNEYGKLSKALNRMLKHIAEDKEKLKDTVMSLEKANLDLKKAQKEIVQAEKLASVGRLSSGIAHEIGNPIGIISGYIELLKQDDITSGDKKEFILRTENEINRINTIIKQLLDLSRPSSEGISPISVHEIIEDTVYVLKYQPLMADIDVRKNLAADTDMVLADGNQLRQVFLNVMINSADAIVSARRGVKGKIVITSETVTKPKEDGSGHIDLVKINTIDNGIGIEKENLDHLFDPFYTTKEPGKGTGLGLSVSYMIVEGVGGEMHVSSHPGEGTTISILLPIHHEA